MLRERECEEWRMECVGTHRGVFRCTVVNEENSLRYWILTKLMFSEG